VEEEYRLAKRTHIGNTIWQVRLMEKIVEKLDDINKTLEGIQKILKTPENRVMTIFKYVGAGVSALGFLSIVELIRQWIVRG
jgi:uncharacterized membrane protein YukC